jgi:hypothetical protein
MISAVRVIAGLATLVLAAVVAGAAAASVSYVETPSKNIVCGYVGAVQGYPAFLECGVMSGLHPAPPKPAHKCVDDDPASNRVRLNGTGAVYGFCAGDVGVRAEAGHAPVLPYGKSWHRGAFTCTSAATGLTCRNSSGHGFFLSRQSWHSV